MSSIGSAVPPPPAQPAPPALSATSRPGEVSPTCSSPSDLQDTPAPSQGAESTSTSSTTPTAVSATKTSAANPPATATTTTASSSSSSSSAPASTGQKRRRFPVSCFECRRRKLKCDREQPCQRCRGGRRECVYANEASPAKVPRVLGDSQYSRKHDDLELSLRHKQSASGRGVFPESNPASTSVALSGSYETYGGRPPDLAVTVPVGRRDSVALLPASQYGGRIGDNDRQQVPISRLLSTAWDCPPVAIGNHNARNGSPEKPKEKDDLKDKVFTRGRDAYVRYFGRSHLSSLFLQFDGLREFAKEAIPLNPYFPRARKEFSVWRRKNRDREENEDLGECIPNLREVITLPLGQVDELVRVYMRTFESTHRILHIPSFWKEYREYWRDKEKGSLDFVAVLLLVMACGLLLHHGVDPLAAGKHRQMAVRWVHSVERYLCHKHRPDMALVRLHCLMILAKRISCIDTHLAWSEVGALVRIAMSMGLHRDPDKLRKISLFHAEMRRRLWATILEIDLQAAMERGMPVLISEGDYDCRPPLDINDWDIVESTEAIAEHIFHPGSLTETSFQVILLRSFPIRLEIARLINNLQFDPPYEEILRLDKEVQRCFRELPQLFRLSTKTPTDDALLLPRQLLDLHIRRFLLLLHMPFAIRAMHDLQYSYSRHVCVENASIILLHLKEFTDTRDLRALFFKDEHVQAALSVCLELHMDKPAAALALSSDMWHVFRDSSMALVDCVLQMLERRAQFLGKGMKDYFFMSMVVAFVKAKESPELSERYMRQSADRCARVCQALTAGPKDAVRKRPWDASSDTDRWTVGQNSGGVGTADDVDQPMSLELPDFDFSFADDLGVSLTEWWDADCQTWL